MTLDDQIPPGQELQAYTHNGQ